MHGQTQAERCDRTAYVSGFSASVTDMELFAVFAKVAHVEKVILRNGLSRHALVVFKTVEGLYAALVKFQGYKMHDQRLVIRPLRESSHMNNDSLFSVGDLSGHQNFNSRPLSSQEIHQTSPLFFLNKNEQRMYHRDRNLTNSGGRRRSSNNNRNYKRNDSYNTVFRPDIQKYIGNHITLDDYSGSAQRFDGLANLIRSNNPMDPFGNIGNRLESRTQDTKRYSRSRSNSAREPPNSKNVPPTWKMELQIKSESADPEKIEQNKEYSHRPDLSDLPIDNGTDKVTPQEIISRITGSSLSNVETAKKKRPNLSVIHPQLFYEQYPRTSSPVVFPKTENTEVIYSPHDPAVVAYRKQRNIPNEFDGLSPIDIGNCSFVTKHLGTVTENIENLPTSREMTNDELSEMIVSTGNLRLHETHQYNYEPAPWSPVKRLRAESGSLSTANVVSPQFSPINAKESELIDFDDEVFSSENSAQRSSNDVEVPKNNGNIENKNILSEQKLPNFDVNNSRLPSNCYSANPNSEKQAFIFPDYPLWRHSSVPSITQLVADLPEISPHLCLKRGGDESSLFRDFQCSSNIKLWDPTNKITNKSETSENEKLSI